MSTRVCYKFRLYVAGNTPNSERAKLNLGALCRAHLAGAYKIELVDVLRHPEIALRDGIFMTPALIKLSPSPTRMIVGTLDRTDALMEGLGLPHSESPSSANGRTGTSH
jgi:circadian clock protein KaiB